MEGWLGLVILVVIIVAIIWALDALAQLKDNMKETRKAFERVEAQLRALRGVGTATPRSSWGQGHDAGKKMSEDSHGPYGADHGHTN